MGLIEGARTPEELETLLEDAFILGDDKAALELFDERGLVAVGSGQPERAEVFVERELHGRGGDTAGALTASRRVLCAGDLALSLGGHLNVSRRGNDGFWRVVISMLDPELG